MRIMAALLAEDRAPSEIVRLYAAEDAKRGRNEPCTCGSGRKWKHCHGLSGRGVSSLTIRLGAASTGSARG